MAIDRFLLAKMGGHLEDGDVILATARNRTVLGDENERYCLSGKGLGVLRKSGFFKWEYSALPYSKMRSIRKDEGTFKSHILVENLDGTYVELMNIDNGDFRDFSGILESRLEERQGQG